MKGDEKEITGEEYQERLREVQSKMMKGRYEWAFKKQEGENALMKLLKSDRKIVIKQSLSLGSDQIFMT